MFNTVLEFLVTVPVQNSVLRALIMVTEMFAAGFILYYLWELVPRLPRAGKAAISLVTVITSIVIFPFTIPPDMGAKGRGETAGSVTRSKEDLGDKPELEPFRDLFTDLVP